jgi:hypothetical protein
MLEDNQIKDYQVIEQVMAKSIKGDPRFNTSVWPGYNVSVFMQFSDDQKAKAVLQEIKEFNRKAINDNELVTACSWTLDDYFFE